MHSKLSIIARYFSPIYWHSLHQSIRLRELNLLAFHSLALFSAWREIQKICFTEHKYPFRNYMSWPTVWIWSLLGGKVKMRLNCEPADFYSNWLIGSRVIVRLHFFCQFLPFWRFFAFSRSFLVYFCKGMLISNIVPLESHRWVDSKGVSLIFSRCSHKKSIFHWSDFWREFKSNVKSDGTMGTSSICWIDYYAVSHRSDHGVARYPKKLWSHIIFTQT